MSLLEKRLSEKILEECRGDLFLATESLHIQAFFKGHKKIDLQMGSEYSFYDLASLTKILFTVTACMKAESSYGRLRKKKLVQELFDWPYKDMQVGQLLQHHAGLPWWNDYYKTLRKISPVGKPLSEVRRLRRQKLWEALKLEPRDLKRKQAVYSDLDFLVLGYYLEALYEKELVKIWEGIQEDHHLETLHFCVNNKPKFSKNRYAPTEKCPWRKKVLQGEVHDDNTWSLLGVSSHAGLFGSIHDVSRWGRELRRSYYERGKGLAPSSIVRAYCRRSLPVTVGDWGYGFMKPSRSQSSAGKHFSASSVGHTGFTGTSFWWDPQKDLMIVILSNRVHPSRKNQKFVALRPLIHDWIVQIL